jgi:hydroxyacylglutathione hydrolase
MIFKQFYLESLGHASYLVGSEQTGEALVLDVRRDVDIYFKEARRQGLRIAYAADTHQHNDYLTGICELPVRGEVQLLASARAELGYKARRLVTVIVSRWVSWSSRLCRRQGTPRNTSA